MSGNVVNRGMFILFEGVDRCGKTTQAQKLVEYFNSAANGKKATFMRFPDRTTTIGKLLSAYLTNDCQMDDHAIHLLFSANRWESADALKKHLLDGKHVIVDRYSYSGVAFSGAKEGVELDWCMQPEMGLLKPDMVIFLDMPVGKLAERAQFGEERYEKEDFQIAVRKNFSELKNNATEQWNIVDADGSIESIHEKIKEIANGFIAENDQKPLEYFK